MHQGGSDLVTGDQGAAGDDGLNVDVAGLRWLGDWMDQAPGHVVPNVGVAGP